LKVFVIIFSLLLVSASFIPNFNSQHWSVRIFDFLKIQLSLLLTLSIGLSFFISFEHLYLEITLKLSLIIALVYNLYFIYPFLSIQTFNSPSIDGNYLSLISVNVRQDNTAYEKLINTVNHFNPSIVLTMESNKDWEDAMKTLENRYKHYLKIPLENKYGMHFYTNLNVISLKKHFLISSEYPSIEAILKDEEGIEFKFWGIHPPPSSPTEKQTSKQKDAELMLLAKKLSKETRPVLVAGDFNNVSWSKTSKLFAKVSGLKDARLGRGVYGTFPSYAYLLQFPIDLVFNSLNLKIAKIKTLSSINSDHLPLLVKFKVKASPRNKNANKEFDVENVNNTIQEGIKAEKAKD